jgi:hypothetical protein
LFLRLDVADVWTNESSKGYIKSLFQAEVLVEDGDFFYYVADKMAESVQYGIAMSSIRRVILISHACTCSFLLCCLLALISDLAGFQNELCYPLLNAAANNQSILQVPLFASVVMTLAESAATSIYLSTS